jgi:hypothetical protein
MRKRGRGREVYTTVVWLEESGSGGKKSSLGAANGHVMATWLMGVIVRVE